MQKKEESNRGEVEEIRAQVTTSQASEKPPQQQQQQPNAAANLQPDSGTQQQTRAPIPKSDDEKRRQIQQMLRLYLHAQNCLRRERLANGAEDCSVPYCKRMRDLLKHLPACRALTKCALRHCISIRQIIGHWNNCSSASDCPVCAPLRQADRNRRTGNIAALDLAVSRPNSRALNPLRASNPSRAAANVEQVQLAAPVADNVVMDLEQPIVASILQTLSPNRPVFAADAARAATLAGTHHSLSAIAVIADVQKRLIRLSESLPDDSTTGGPHSSDAFDINDIIPIPSRVQWDWHRNALPALRKHLIKELVQTIISTSELPAILDRHMHSMMHYSQKVESMLFEEAESKSRYFHLLAEKIYKLQIEFATKQEKYKINVDKIGELLRTGSVTDTLTTRVIRLPTHQQRQPDYRPHQQRARQTGNLRVNPMHSPQRRRQPPGLQLPPMPNTTQTVTLHLDSILELHQQRRLREWYKNQQQWLFERQQMEQTVPSINSGYYEDADDFSAMSM